MKTNNKIKNVVLKTIAKISFKAAEENANSTCMWWHHQQVLPDEVKKLRKF